MIDSEPRNFDWGTLRVSVRCSANFTSNCRESGSIDTLPAIVLPAGFIRSHPGAILPGEG